MEGPLEKLADVLASIHVAEEALETHVPASCPGCAEALRSRHYLACGEARDWSGYLAQLVVDARQLLSVQLARDPEGFNEDEEDLVRSAAPMLDAYGTLLRHTCPECRGGTPCPASAGMRVKALAATTVVLKYGTRILARACS